MSRTVQTKVKTSKGRGPEVPSTQELDGKAQPISQYKLISKEPGKNTQEIKQGWHDSITVAHKMLVEVNQELEKILEELDEISKALDKLNKNSGTNNAVKRFKEVHEYISKASATSEQLVKDFINYLPGTIKFAASKIYQITEKDFLELENKIGSKKVTKLRAIFDRIKLLEKNMKIKAHAVNPDAGQEKIKKANQPFNRKLFSVEDESIVGENSYDSDDDSSSSSEIDNADSSGSSEGDENNEQGAEPKKKQSIVGWKAGKSGFKSIKR